MKEKRIQIGDNSASLKMSVEVENGVLSSSGRSEFIPLKGKKGGFGKSSFVERMSLLAKDQFKRQRVFGIKAFLPEMNYQKSETEYQTISLLYEEYTGFCQMHHVHPIRRVEFLRRLESLGFVVRRCIAPNATFVYCKKGKATL